jgi:hypothetical protein
LYPGDPKPRYIKVRSFLDAKGNFLDLGDVFDVLKDKRFGNDYRPGGRGMAGSLSKTPMMGLDIARVASDVAEAVSEALKKQRP